MEIEIKVKFGNGAKDFFKNASDFFAINGKTKAAELAREILKGFNDDNICVIKAEFKMYNFGVNRCGRYDFGDGETDVKSYNFNKDCEDLKDEITDYLYVISEALDELYDKTNEISVNLYNYFDGIEYEVVDYDCEDED